MSGQIPSGLQRNNHDPRPADPLRIGSKKQQGARQGFHRHDAQAGGGDTGHRFKKAVDKGRHRQKKLL